MRLSGRDKLATVFVGVAVLLYALWLIGTDLPGMSGTQVITGVVLGLGFAASASAVVPGFDALLHGSKAYLALTSVIGLGALAAGILALVTEHEAWLAAVVTATVVLWVISTARHARATAARIGRHGTPRGHPAFE